MQVKGTDASSTVKTQTKAQKTASNNQESYYKTGNIGASETQTGTKQNTTPTVNYSGGPGTVNQPVQTTQPAAQPTVDYQQLYADALNRLSNQQTTRDQELEDLKSEYQNLYQQQYADALAQQQKAIQAGVDQAVSSISGQKDTVSQQYADTLRQLYIDKMNAQKNIGQQMAAMGQTGGQAESTLLGLNTDYAENLRQSEQAKASALSELDRAIADAQLSGSIEGANAAAQNAVDSTNAYAQVLQNLIAQKNTENQTAANQASENRQYAYNLAVQLLQSGTMPSSDLLTTAGISQYDAQALMSQVNAQSKSYGSGKTTTEETITKSQADTILKAALARGTISADDKATLEAYYGNTLADLAASNGYETPTVQKTSAQKTAAGKTGSTEEDNDYSAALKSTSGMTDYERRASNYQTVLSNATKIYNSSGKQKALEFLKETYNGEDQMLNLSDYMQLYKKFRNM